MIDWMRDECGITPRSRICRNCAKSRLLLFPSFPSLFHFSCHHLPPLLLLQLQTLIQIQIPLLHLPTIPSPGSLLTHAAESLSNLASTNPSSTHSLLSASIDSQFMGRHPRSQSVMLLQYQLLLVVLRRSKRLNKLGGYQRCVEPYPSD